MHEAHSPPPGHSGDMCLRCLQGLFHTLQSRMQLLLALEVAHKTARDCSQQLLVLEKRLTRLLLDTSAGLVAASDIFPGQEEAAREAMCEVREGLRERTATYGVALVDGDRGPRVLPPGTRAWQAIQEHLEAAERDVLLQCQECADWNISTFLSLGVPCTELATCACCRCHGQLSEAIVTHSLEKIQQSAVWVRRLARNQTFTLSVRISTFGNTLLEMIDQKPPPALPLSRERSVHEKAIWSPSLHQVPNREGRYALLSP